MTVPLRFIVDHNAGKLARWLRMMGYDTLFFTGADDGDMVRIALAQDRVILTRDTRIAQRRVVASGRLRVVIIQSGSPAEQLGQVRAEIGLDVTYRPFTLCLERNRPLEVRSREDVKRLVPAYVYRTQEQYMACPGCHRIYWRGTHWEAMTNKLAELVRG